MLMNASPIPLLQEQIVLPLPQTKLLSFFLGLRQRGGGQKMRTQTLVFFFSNVFHNAFPKSAPGYT